MGRNDHRRADAVHLLEQLHQPFRLTVIQIAGRLVRQQQRRTGDDRAGDGDALLLAAGQRGRLRVDMAGQSDPAQQFADIGAYLAFRPAGDAQRQGHVVERGKMRQQAEILKHHADSPAQRRQCAARRGGHIRTQQLSRPRVGRTAR